MTDYEIDTCILFHEAMKSIGTPDDFEAACAYAHEVRGT